MFLSLNKREMNQMSKTSLLIIDVQDYFSTAAAVVEETVREIKLAKRRGASVVVAEYGPVSRCGRSNQRVLDELKGYDKAIFVTKTTDGGGVNRCFCVASTLSQIFDIFRNNSQKVKIEVSEEGTNCDFPSTGINSLVGMGCKII
jgi:hypothetical protein